MKKSRASIVIAAIMALVLVLAACSKKADTATGDTATSTQTATSTETTATLSADEYATTVCGALSDWLNYIQTSSASLPAQMSSPQQAKTELVSFLQGVSDATDTMVGAEAQQQIVDSLTNVQDIFNEAADTVANLDTTDQAAFGKAIQQIGTGMQDASSGAVGGLDSITSSDLNTAFANNATCQSLSGGMASPSA
jgi:hypothetical protein